jgi:integrase
MASLQARHQRSCKLARPWTPAAQATRPAGCTCTPMYHVVLRHDGKLVREPVGHNRKEAERALDGRRGDVARREYRVLDDKPFAEWADEWLAAFTGKPTTKRTYGDTIALAKATFGSRKVRDLAAGDVRRFLDRGRDEYKRRRPTKEGEPEREVSQATLARHLRQLGACLQAAVSEGYASENPVRKLHKTARPKVAKSRPAYFTDAELARLWPELVERPVYLALAKTAVLTGARFGELAGLDWNDVDLLARELHVRRTYDAEAGVMPPKGGEERTIDLTPQAATVLETWLKESGDDGLVFEREEGGHLNDDYIRKLVLYPAMERAGIPRVGEGGRARTFHSFRHTFARVALEHAAPIDWVRRQLGHSSIVLTVETYGEWSRSAQKAEAEKLAAAFPV